VANRPHAKPAPPVHIFKLTREREITLRLGASGRGKVMAARCGKVRAIEESPSQAFCSKSDDDPALR